MPSQAGAVFDIPQNLPSALTRLDQVMREYDDQPVMISLRKAGVTTGARSDNWTSSYFYDHPQPNIDFTVQLRTLHQHYTILDNDHTVTEILKTEPALYSLLIEAVEPLRHAFGNKRLMYIRIQSSDEDSILKVTVRLPANFGDDPERALQAFDEEWWLNNCHRSGSALVFDYEMPDAIRLA
jgi:hypothetical protein